MGFIMDTKLAKKLHSSICGLQKFNKKYGKTVKEIEVSYIDIYKKYDDQDGKCYYTGFPLEAKYNYISYHPFAISVERLDNNLSYNSNNIVLTTRFANLARCSYEGDFFSIINEMKDHFIKIDKP
jgi:hypothetical protein